MQKQDKITINGRHIDRTQTRITVTTGIAGVVDVTDNVSSVSYSAEQTKEFGQNLGLYPSHFAVGGIMVSGSITLSDGGVDMLDKAAKELGGLNLLDLGQTFAMDIVVEYTMNDGSLSTDTLHLAHFTTYPRGVNKDTLIMDREIPLIAAQLLTE